MTDLPEVPRGANMEDCPRCTDPNPVYPWICPGHPAETVADTTETDIYIHLRHTLAEAFRTASYECDGDCGLDEPACRAAHPVQVAAYDFSRVGEVTADVEALANVVIKSLFTNEKHVYFSTSCLHDDHRYCQQETGNMGLKRPSECKFCNRPCQCTCHDGTRSR